MSKRFAEVSRLAARQHGAVSAADLERLGVERRRRSKWIAQGLLAREGPRAFFVTGSAPTWRRTLWAAAANARGLGALAGRSAARLHGLDGFGRDHVPELLLERVHRGTRLPYVVRFTSGSPGNTVTIDGIRCLTAEALIVESPRFGFTKEETENAIDSAIRMRADRWPAAARTAGRRARR